MLLGVVLRCTHPLTGARILVRANNTWNVRGRFDKVVERTPPVSWDLSNEVPTLTLLAVSLDFWIFEFHILNQFW